MTSHATPKKTPPSPADVYQLALQDNQRTPVGELAARLGMRTPHFTKIAIQYAQEHNEPYPKFLFHRKPPTDKNLNQVTRTRATLDIRVNSYALAAAGLSDVLDFELVPDPTTRTLTIRPSAVEAPADPPARILLQTLEGPKSGQASRKPKKLVTQS